MLVESGRAGLEFCKTGNSVALTHLTGLISYHLLPAFLCSSHKMFFPYALCYCRAFAKTYISLSLRQALSFFIFSSPSDQSSQLRHHFFRDIFPKDFRSTLHFHQTPRLLLCKHIYLCHSIINVCLPSDLSSLKARTAVTTCPKRTRYDLGEQYTCIKSIILYHLHFIVTIIPPTLVRSKRKNW